MTMLLTMPDLTWTVRVHRWTWYYTFSHIGTVSWRDPFNGKHGNGSWRIQNGKLITRWNASKTWEEWDMPIFPLHATGTCHMEEGTYNLLAEAQNYYLQPGDVVYSGLALVRTSGTHASIIYQDEVRSGGTIAWICRNPGNIREGERYGAYKGKRLHIPEIGSYSIFPDETTGLMAVISVLRGYGHVTINQAMHKYAPKGDGHNNPDTYAATLAAGLKVKDSTDLTTLSDEQMARMANLITGVEHTVTGMTYSLDDYNLPQDIRQRLSRH